MNKVKMFRRPCVQFFLYLLLFLVGFFSILIGRHRHQVFLEHMNRTIHENEEYFVVEMTGESSEGRGGGGGGGGGGRDGDGALGGPAYPATIVTAYYQVKSKRAAAVYLAWIANFMSLETPMVIFTDEAGLKLLQPLRPPCLLNITRFVKRGMGEFFTARYRDAFIRQHVTHDPEAKIHSPELYSIWNEKVRT